MNTIFENNIEAEKTMELAIGRILALGSRPFQDGDVQKYEAAKSAFFEAADFLGIQTSFLDNSSFQANYYKVYHD
jgi:hypothetical protein